jgi:hypothetical protein
MNLTRLDRFLGLLLGIGGLTLIAGIIWAPNRIWPNLLLVSYFLVCLGLAGIFFVALQYASGASWSVSLRRVPEAMSAILPYGALGLALVFVFRFSLYPWTGATIGHEPLAWFKQVWLNLPFFLGRSAIYLLLWIVFTLAIIHTSRRQDRDGDLRHTFKNRKLSVAFLVVFSITFWLASYDWIMSLEPGWYSTIFGVYNFAGLFSGGLAALILLVLWLRSAGPLRDFINEEHLHDLGKLLFAFCTFWMYIWFSQYMLIWYAGIPEETSYFIRRQHGFWQPLFLLDLFLNWAIPFLLLLSKRPKRNPGLLAKAAAVVLIGRWLDLYLMIIPPFAGASPVFGLWEVGMIAGAVALFLLVFIHALRQAPLVPVRDPYLAESLHYHN